MNTNRNTDYFKELADKWVQGTIEKEECAYFESWYHSFNDEQLILPDSRHASAEALKDHLFGAIQNKRSESITPKSGGQASMRLWYRFSAAAVFLIAIFGGLLFYFNPQTIGNHSQQDLGPGGQKAMLTLANGQVIFLNDTISGKLADQNGVRIDKTSNGELVYQAKGQVTAQKSNENTSFNSLSTPRGGQYQIVLPDGTKVWLNAASILTYPTIFTGKERLVDLKGEAYFEVAKQRIPFVVKTPRQEVRVLGTHFNINAYTDEEKTSTTLLEGAVLVNTKGLSPVLLKPNQQAILSNNYLKVVSVDVEAAVAWKNDLFLFENADLEMVMRQIGRWYDLDIEYHGEIPKSTFNGKISRHLKLSKVLDILKYYKVNFSLKGKKLVISP